MEPVESTPLTDHETKQLDVDSTTDSNEEVHKLPSPTVSQHLLGLSVPSSADNLDRESQCPSKITLVEIAPHKDEISSTCRKSSDSVCGKYWGCHYLQVRQFREDTENDSTKKLPKNVRKYYKQQHEIVEAFEDTALDEDEAERGARMEAERRSVSMAVRVSLACNALLLIAKIVASYLSGSLSIISSLVDSAVDLVSGIIFWYTTRSIKSTNFYEYPSGKTRLEPLAVIILSVVMTVAAIQLVITSVKSIIDNSADPDISISTIIIIAATIVIKFLLFLYCRRIKAVSTNTLAQDHRNDVLSNAVAIGMGYLGFKVWKNADPIGGIIISLYIAYGWWKTGSEHVRSLTGHSARPELLQKLLWVCVHHDSRVQYIDTLRAFHFGNNLLVEAHIVLPPEMTLHEAHDIGELLQQKLERYPNVERAFVHIDYEYEHHPTDEHKMGQKPLNVEV